MRNIHEELTGVFREVFNDPKLEISRDTTASDVEGWDSFSYINLITAIEIHFDIEFTQSEVFGFENVGELMDTVSEKI